MTGFCTSQKIVLLAMEFVSPTIYHLSNTNLESNLRFDKDMSGALFCQTG